jgi:hypothetical protein
MQHLVLGIEQHGAVVQWNAHADAHGVGHPHAGMGFVAEYLARAAG